VTAAAERFGHLTALINNAAGNFVAAPKRSPRTPSPRSWTSFLKGTFHYTQVVARRWIAESQPGNVLNIVTTYAERGSGFVVPSACAKAGVVAMTRSLAIEWARYRIRVNAEAAVR
jgi:NAD(P)-dependent dehydrogenase (short-subunit alcohol dehydrogenase family)